MIKKTAIMVFAPGYEEVEALSAVDLLRRAEVAVKMVSLNGEAEVTSSHGVTLRMDGSFSDVLDELADAVILPGGMPGTTYLRQNENLKNYIIQMNEKKKIVAAICAAPTVLLDCGIVFEKKVTSYPSFENEFKDSNYLIDSVVVDENIITSRGVGTALEFGLVLVEKLVSKETSDKIRTGIVLASR